MQFQQNKQKLDKWPSLDSWHVESGSTGSKPLSAKTQGSKLAESPELGSASVKSASMRSSVSMQCRQSLLNKLLHPMVGVVSYIYRYFFLGFILKHKLVVFYYLFIFDLPPLSFIFWVLLV